MKHFLLKGRQVVTTTCCYVASVESRLNGAFHSGNRTYEFQPRIFLVDLGGIKIFFTLEEKNDYSMLEEQHFAMLLTFENCKSKEVFINEKLKFYLETLNPQLLSIALLPNTSNEHMKFALRISGH